MTPKGVKIIDHGMDAIEAQVKSLDGMGVEVGVFGDLADIATWNEYGTRTIPPRSFMRSTMDARASDIREVHRKVIAAVTLGKLQARQAMGILGTWMVAAVVKKIDSNVPPPNAPSTIRQKGSSHTLIDTGRLRASVTYRVTEDGAEEGEE